MVRQSIFAGLGLVALTFAPAREGRAQPTPGAVVGRVLDATGQPLPGATVALIDPNGDSMVLVTGSRGEFAFGEVGPGECQLRVDFTGYEPSETTFTMESDTGTRFDVTLQIAAISETVVIRDRPVGTAGAEPSEPVELKPEQFDSLPLPTDRFQEALPLVPGVVRDPEGRLSFNGSRPSQSQLLVNGANVTDPVTGEFAVELPLKAIEAVEINSLPYSAEYGRVSGAVAKVKTRGGTDEFDIDYGDLFPRPNFRGGSLRGLRSFFPQVQISGPIKKGSAWFSQGIAYRYRRSRIFDAAEGDDERVLESFDTLTQLDFRIRDRHEVTTTFSFFPVEVDNLGLSAVVTSDAAPEFESTGWNAAVSERSFFSRAVVETILAVKRFDVRVRPTGGGVTSLTPEGLRGDYFNRLERDSLRLELGSAVTYSPKTLMGAHVLKFGGNVARTKFSGLDDTAPIDLLDAEGSRVRRIEYIGDPTVEGFDVQASAFVQDQWRMNDRVGLDIGLRYDYDRLVGSHRLAPRAAAAVAVDEGGRTVIKTGFGIFYDHVFLQADRFDDYQTRIETPYDEDGNPGEAIVLRPQRSAEGLSMPRGLTWNVELGQLVGDFLQLRVNYRERYGSREMIVDRLENGADGTMLLSSSGESTARELDVTARFQRGENELNASFVRARSTGDLNGLGTLYQSFRSPLLLANERSLFELDVPARALFWGIWHLPADIIVSPGLEWRKGFPYTSLTADYEALGVRNDRRFPNFFSFDLRVTKGLTVKGRRIRVGFQIFNFAAHFNPRDVIASSASPRFGQFLNSPDMGFGIRFSLGS